MVVAKAIITGGGGVMTYDLVESALSKSIEVVVNWSEYKDLETIAIDEIALKKGHNYYLTIISVKGKNGVKL